MKTIAGSRQSFQVHNPQAFTEALYRRVLELARHLGEFSANTIAGALRTEHRTIKPLVERMEAEGLCSGPDHRGRRKVLEVA